MDILRLGHPLLRQKSRPLELEEIGQPELEQDIEAMTAAMRAHDGIGIAAPQIGIMKQIFMIEIGQENTRYEVAESVPIKVFINPVITKSGGPITGNWEGCLSIPDMRGYVQRPSEIECEYLDLEGVPKKGRLQGFPAVVFQHEKDHLDGVLYVDHLQSNKHLAFLDEFMAHIQGAPPDDLKGQ